MAATALETELLRVLDAEKSYQPMSGESLRKVLRALGHSPLPDEDEIVVVLEGLLNGGWIEAVNSSRLGRRFRIQRHDRGDMSEAVTITTKEAEA